MGVEKRKLDKPQMFKINGRKHRISYVETDYTEIRKEDAYNVIWNTALLGNGKFLARGKELILARVTDVVGDTMIHTDWGIPKKLFNGLVLKIQFEKYVPEHRFYVLGQ